MSVLKITVAGGDTHEVPFGPSSTVTVKTRIAKDGAAMETVEQAYTDVVDVELSDKDPGVTIAPASEEQAMLSSPGVAIFHAKQLPLADAAAHVEKALERWPDDGDLLTVWDDIDAAARAGADTWSTNVEPDLGPELDEVAQLHAAIDQIGSHAEANEAAQHLHVDGFEEKTPKLDEKKAALHAAVDEHVAKNAGA